MPAIVTATVAGASLWISVAMNSYGARLPQIQLLEEVAALGIDSDEEREIGRLDPTGRFQSNYANSS